MTLMIQFRFVKFWIQLMSNFPIEVKNKLSCRRYWFTRVNLISSLVFVWFEFLELPKFKIRSISNIVRHLFILKLWVQKFYLDFRCHGSKNLNQTLDSFSFTNVNFFFFSSTFHFNSNLSCQVSWTFCPSPSVSGSLCTLTMELDLSDFSTSYISSLRIS